MNAKRLMLTLGVLLTLAVASVNAQNVVNVDLPNLAGGHQVSLTYRVRIGAYPFDMAFVDNQGVVSGTNFADVLTDDPNTAQASDPTRTFLLARVRELPATGETPFWRDMLLVGGLVLAGMFALWQGLRVRARA